MTLSLRFGRSSVRFLHSYHSARVSTTQTGRIVQPLLSKWHGSSSCVHPAVYTIARSYADGPAGRPKAHTGRTAAKSPRATKGAARKTATKPSTKKTKKAKKTTKKKTAKKPAKKVLTEEQKARKVARERTVLIRELKKQSLKKQQPKHNAVSAWQIMFTERSKGSGPFATAQERGNFVKELSVEFKSLSPEQREHYNHSANMARTAGAERHAAWVASLTPVQIKEANDARKRLTSLGIKGYRIQIQDDRQVKRPAVAHTFFLRERIASGDFKGIANSEAFKLVFGEWRDLPESEKERYRQLQRQDKERYEQERREVYGK